MTETQPSTLQSFRSKYARELTILLLLVLGSFGIATGLIPRLDNWDVVQNPVPIIYSVFHWLVHPFSNLQINAFTQIFTLLFLLVYLLLTAFGRLVAGNRV